MRPSPSSVPVAPPATGLILRDLPLAARLTLATFLISVGIGYLSALVNLHFQEATPGEALPNNDNVLAAYHGTRKMSQLERLLTANSSLRFNGQGSMWPALTKQKVAGWSRTIKRKAEKLGRFKLTDESMAALREASVPEVVLTKLHPLKEQEFDREQLLAECAAKIGKEDLGRFQKLLLNHVEKLDSDVKKFAPAYLARIEKACQADLDGERIALIAWGRRADAERKTFYEEDAFPLAGEVVVNKKKIDLGKMPINSQFVKDSDTVPRMVMVQSILEARCVRCHSEKVGGAGARFPLDKYEDVEGYLTSEGPTGKSLPRLALTTHVHLLAFSVLYGLTGLIFAFSGWPRWLCVLVAPLPLLAQVVDISFWWLARMDAPLGPMFATLIPISGGIVALGLGLQILLGLFSLFGRFGKFILVLLLLAALAGGYVAKTNYLDRYLKTEAGNPGEMVE
jgi:hypothetical protein